jgi:hypothetical protein
VAVARDDIDRLLDATSEVGPDLPAERIRAWRDQLAHVAVLLAYARHVLSVDVRVLRDAVDAPGSTFDAVVQALPETLTTASVGGGWSLSPDAPATMHSAEQLVEGEADELLALHSRLVGSDIARPGDVEPLLAELEVQLAWVTERWEAAEARLRRLQSELVTKYKTGEASVDDWLG